jgi:hypothetical protein
MVGNGLRVRILELLDGGLLDDDELLGIAWEKGINNVGAIVSVVAPCAALRAAALALILASFSARVIDCSSMATIK